MRKIIVLSMITLDGVIQAPGGPEEDTADDFKYGGWVAPFTDDVYGQVVQKEMQPADYLLGRKTFEIWADYWPKHHDAWPAVNNGTKYVFSEKLTKTDPLITGWQKSVLIESLEDIKTLKQSVGADMQVWGSSQLVHLLLENDLVDELRLKIHPLLLGKGKKLFNNAALPTTFSLSENIITPGGVIIAIYQRKGEVETGSVKA